MDEIRRYDFDDIESVLPDFGHVVYESYGPEGFIPYPGPATFAAAAKHARGLYPWGSEIDAAHAHALALLVGGESVSKIRVRDCFHLGPAYLLTPDGLLWRVALCDMPPPRGLNGGSRTPTRLQVWTEGLGTITTKQCGGETIFRECARLMAEALAKRAINPT